MGTSKEVTEPQDRLAAALGHTAFKTTWDGKSHGIPPHVAEQILAADPTIAADMELGRRIRDASDPLLAEAIPWPPSDEWVAQLRAALTEGEKPNHWVTGHKAAPCVHGNPCRESMCPEYGRSEA